ncbi:energy transducer TonB [Hymenobacter armeniacus]|uniref:Energy transducer TonB n=1 Tax=Hymenobacter armeniacus TaxID=2771358 RepID=A0ABR8JXB9_9BACT|nr:energy transducer TonB [Hymenobacter armeniacus]MBD2723551.1 energy transducer TonB [Hymenobacter armeniacus]
MPCSPVFLPRILSLATAFFFVGIGFAAAQTAAPVPEPAKPGNGQEVVIDGKVYTYVEQMPQLPGGGGNRAIVNAIQANVKYPAEALKHAAQGRVFVSFTIGEDGMVRDSKIVKGIGWGCDEAVLEAVKQLPQFTPGTQQGRPVSVSFTVPVTFQITMPPPARK